MSKQQVMNWAATQEQLDIYTMTAFIVGTGQRRLYPIYFWKLIACCGLQIFGSVFLTTTTLKKNGFYCSGNDICAGDMSNEAWMAFFFVSFVSISCAEKLRNLGWFGMYQWGVDQPEFVSKVLVVIGLYAKMIVIVLSWLCSFILIFASRDLPDMVLNSVAVLFIITIDNEIVFDSDYANVSRGGWSSKSKGAAALDKGAVMLMKVQSLWTCRPLFCTLFITVLTLIAPIFTIACFNTTAKFDEYCVEST